MAAFSLTVVLIGTLSATPVVAPQSDQPKTAEEAVKMCVDAVRATKTDEMFEQPYFKGFDAYYNPATQTVENNAYRNGDTRPLYTFNKCMAQKGFPLGPKSKN